MKDPKRYYLNVEMDEDKSGNWIHKNDYIQLKRYCRVLYDYLSLDDHAFNNKYLPQGLDYMIKIKNELEELFREE